MRGGDGHEHKYGESRRPEVYFPFSHKDKPGQIIERMRDPTRRRIKNCDNVEEKEDVPLSKSGPTPTLLIKSVEEGKFGSESIVWG